MAIVTEATIDAVRELNTRLFYMNRRFDAAMSVLKIDYVCDQASALMHSYMAHFFPSFADEVNDKCLEQFNIKTFYGETPAECWSFTGLVDMMNQLNDEVLHTQSLLMGVIDIAQSNKDYLVVSELFELLNEFNTIVAQMLLIRDKAEQYGDDGLYQFDRHFPSFFYLNQEEAED